MPLQAGMTLGANVQLERELGRGAMGVVWLARNTSLGSQVAVKVLNASRESSNAHLRFAQEAQRAAQLDSPHVVKIFDFGTTPEGEPYIVMELLRGRDLREHIEKHGRLSPAATLAIVQQLCRALTTAHRAGVIHRDIKPANVFLLEPDGEPFVKMLDFGIAKSMQEDMGMTATGTVVGTPYYMSPEQFVDPRSIDHRSDLWSLAVVVYGCLCGRLPFAGETVGAITLAVHSGQFVAPTQIQSDLPAACDRFFTQALATKPELRFASAETFAKAFAQAVGGQPHQAYSSQAPVAHAAAHGAASWPQGQASSHGTGGGQAQPASAASGFAHASTYSSEIANASAGYAVQEPSKATVAMQAPPASSMPAAGATQPHASVAAKTPNPSDMARYGGPMAHGAAPSSNPAQPAGGYPLANTGGQSYGAAAIAVQPAAKSGRGLGLVMAGIGLVGAVIAGFFFFAQDDAESPVATAAVPEQTAASGANNSAATATAEKTAATAKKKAPSQARTAKTAQPKRARSAPQPPSVKPSPNPPPSKPPAKGPTTVPDTTGLSSVLRSCWAQKAAAHSGYGKSASQATVAIQVNASGRPEGCSVSGPAASFGGFRSCVISSSMGHARTKFGSREAGKTVVASAPLPACTWDKAAQRWRCG